MSINTDTKAGRAAFDTVKNRKTKEYPEGNCYLAWQRLINKYAPKTAPSYIKLRKEFINSKLGSADEDPDERITDLESLRTKMDTVNITGKN